MVGRGRAHCDDRRWARVESRGTAPPSAPRPVRRRRSPHATLGRPRPKPTRGDTGYTVGHGWHRPCLAPFGFAPPGLRVARRLQDGRTDEWTDQAARGFDVRLRELPLHFPASSKCLAARRHNHKSQSISALALTCQVFSAPQAPPWLNRLARSTEPKPLPRSLAQGCPHGAGTCSTSARRRAPASLARTCLRSLRIPSDNCPGVAATAAFHLSPRPANRGAQRS